MKTILTYLLIILSLYSYGQCDLYSLGGDYKPPNPNSKTESISVFISTDINDREIVVFDFFGKDDTVLVESRIINGELINHYRIEPDFFESDSYRIKKVYHTKCFFMLKIKRNKDRVKWVLFDEDKVCLVHKHGLFRKCVISFKNIKNEKT